MLESQVGVGFPYYSNP